MMDRTLVIVDMQPSFEAVIQPVVKANENQIKIARHKGWPIVVVLYSNKGRLARRLQLALAGYEKRVTVWKSEWDGSEEVLAACDKHKFPHGLLRVTGVYAECCVLATIDGLLAECRRRRIEVVKAAVNGYTPMPFKGYDNHRIKFVPNKILAERV